MNDPMHPSPLAEANSPSLSPQPTRRRAWIRRAGPLLAGVAGIAIGTIVWMYHTHRTTMIDDERHAYEATVVMNGKNIIPATLTIKPSTEIFFENHSKSDDQGEAGLAIHLLQSKAATNQAPNFHAGAILADSGYGYIFRKSGTYQFFNADAVQQTVTVIVK